MSTIADRIENANCNSARGAGGSNGLTGVAPLDPENWDDLRVLGLRMVDDMLSHLQTVRERPVWQPVPPDVRARLGASLDPEGMGERAAYDEFLRDVLPYGIGNIHPRFWGWVIGSGTPFGALSEMLSAAMNPNVSGINGAPVLVEKQTIAWLKEMLGYHPDASGLFVSGGSVANLVGLAVGLSARAGFDVLNQGLARAPKPPVLYTSTQTHFSVGKTARTLGLGDAGVRVLPVNEDYGMELDALEAAIARDRADGLHPFAIVATAGTTNTGAFDDLERIADIAEREGLWLHVDGAFGAFAALVPEYARLVAGMERADSLAFDLHKWFLAPIEAGVVLVRDAEAHANAFGADAGYLQGLPGGLANYDLNYHALGPQLTRGFKALKVWLAIKAHGVAPYAEVVRRNVAQARYLERLIGEHPELELMAPVPLNVVCFRFVGEDELGDASRDESQRIVQARELGVMPPAGRGSSERGTQPKADLLNQLNTNILVRLQESGVAAPTNTTLKGNFVIRVCITNHRTRDDDMDVLVREVVRIGRELSKASA